MERKFVFYSEKGETVKKVFSEDDKPLAEEIKGQALADGVGNLLIPCQIARKLGMAPGAKLEIRADHGRIEIRPNIHSLARVYIELTSKCNLTCQTCIRNTWNEPLGDLDKQVFERLVGQLKSFPHLDSVMFGGFGEPTLHKDIHSMIGRIKTLGVKTEIVTNGTLLDELMLKGLFENKLDTLWVSFDGMMKTSFEDIREGASFYQILDNLKRLQSLNEENSHKIDVGIAFVVMKKNIEDLKNINELIHSIGAKFVSVSNVLPYTEEMEKEMVCSLALTLETFASVRGKTEINLPRFDINSITRETILSLLKGYDNLSLMGNKIAAEIESCRFIKDRCAFIRWDGKVSPCMGLLHSHISYLYGMERKIRCYDLGDINSGNLSDIWKSKEYTDFREKVSYFNFSPCHVCGGCNLLEENKEDCFGTTFPACGGCLWAQGIIQCP